MKNAHEISSPLSGWLGGKYQLSEQILSLFPTHHTYVEVFAGAAWVLFRKPTSKVEIINDINKELVTFYRVLQNHFAEFCRSFEWALISRVDFEHYKHLPAEMLTDIQRAVRFYYLQRNCFGGRMDDSPSFGVSASRPPRSNHGELEKSLKAAHERLNKVYVECLPYTEIIRRNDRPETFFYLDPPYWDCEKYYGKGVFDKEDFTKLAEQLASIKGKFLLSLNDTPAVREIFKNFKIETTEEITYTVGAHGNVKTHELFIRNY